MRTIFSDQDKSGEGSSLLKLGLLALVCLILMSGGMATTITEENIRIDLGNSEASADVTVGELTSSDFIYITNTEASDLNATLSGKTLECSTEELALGTQIECDVNQTRNFTVKMDFKMENIIDDKDSVQVFNFQQPIYRPTDEYNLEVVLPRGSALKSKENSTQQIISPLDYQTSSNGRRISVEWETEPQLGETLSFYVLYENFNNPQQTSGGFLDRSKIAVIVVSGGLVLLLSGLIAYRFLSHEELSNKYEELSEDEIDVLELMKEEDGEFLQKDLVDELDYSKAKVSDIVSSLVEKEIIEKKKDGRSNKLSIVKKYSY